MQKNTKKKQKKTIGIYYIMIVFIVKIVFDTSIVVKSTTNLFLRDNNIIKKK